MPYEHWFVSRQKRQLTTILPALVAFSDVCLGEVWSGNHELQLKFEDELQNRSITEHGKLRARKTGDGGGGIRTLFKQMKDLGLVFTEDDNKKCRLTLMGESLVRGDLSFVEGMRVQLQKYQYPSATSFSGSGSISRRFNVHPFQFIFRLLTDDRLSNYLHIDEMRFIVIHFADSDSDKCFEEVVSDILFFRKMNTLNRPISNPEDKEKTYWNIANTFFNYISLTQYIDRGKSSILLRKEREAQARGFIQYKPKFIPHPELQENYIRAFGRGTAAKDLRDFEKEKATSQHELIEKRIRQEFVLLCLKKPVNSITSDIVLSISDKTGINEAMVEKTLIRNYPHGNIDDFFTSYRELAHMGTAGATDFEKATVELFRNVFHMNAIHVGPIGNTPDVFVESDEYRYCGILDNKAYKNGYSIIGDHKRRMIDEYIPNYKQYGHTEYPLGFFSYIAGSFGKGIDIQISEISARTGISGSAMPVDILIDFAEDYNKNNYTHEDIRRIFSLGKLIKLEDINL